MALKGYLHWIDANIFIPYFERDSDVNVDNVVKISKNTFRQQNLPPLSYGARDNDSFYQIFDSNIFRSDPSIFYKSMGASDFNCGFEVSDILTPAGTRGFFSPADVYNYEGTGLLLNYSAYQGGQYRVFRPNTSLFIENIPDELYIAAYYNSTFSYTTINYYTINDGQLTNWKNYNLTVYNIEGDDYSTIRGSDRYVEDFLKIYEEIPPQATPINFYAEPAVYEVNSGEIVTPNFVIVYDDDTVEEHYTNVTYDDSNYFKPEIAELQDDGISIKVNTETLKRLTFIARPNIEGTEFYATVAIVVLDAKNPYFPEGDSGTGGGNGSYGNGENYFDTVGRIPNGSAEANDSRSTLYTRYLVSLTEMSVLGEWLWADDLGLQIAKTAISLLYGDPVQTVISCVSYPFNVASLASSSSVPFHWGGHEAGFSLSALNSNAFSIDWGSIFLSEYWGNFLDYSPHTQMQLYLPWGTGFVHIDPNDILNANSNSSWTGTGTLGIKTNVDLSRGICVHHVIANSTVIGSYSGSCGRQIPITGSDYASKQVAMAGAAIGAMVAGGVSAGMGAASGTANAERNFITAPSAGGFGPPTVQSVERRFNWSSAANEARSAGMQAIRPAIASAAALAVSPPSVSRSGSFQEGAGSLSIQQPYLIISRPKMSMPQNYGHMYGYPSNISATLSSLSGYTEVGNIHLEGIYATSEELNEIESLLKSGVLL